MSGWSGAQTRISAQFDIPNELLDGIVARMLERLAG
jgi:hypothetical protein